MYARELCFGFRREGEAAERLQRARGNDAVVKGYVCGLQKI